MREQYHGILSDGTVVTAADANLSPEEWHALWAWGYVRPEGSKWHPDDIFEVLGPGAPESAALAWDAAVKLGDPILLDGLRRYGLLAP